jgi:hypothetical protein
MTAIVSRDHADDRADALAAANLNGLRLILVALPPGPAPDHAELELRFWTDRHVAAILAEITADPVRAGRIFRVRGGLRVPAGNLPGQVRVVAVAAGSDATRLNLRVEPVGDYSTYLLELVYDASRIDPFFAELGFKFRPGCFTNDCAPALPGRPALPGPVIDYLAKDYDSFRHVLMTAMAARVPGWQSTSEADHDQVLIDLFAAAADELSDFQDRVMSEAYLATTRKRVSLARHARLVDYHLHEGNQASTWLALEVTPGQAPFTLAAQTLVAWTGADEPLPESIFFASREHRLPPAERQRLDPLLNALRLHTWSDAQPALRAGSTCADVVPLPAGGGGGGQAEADALRDLVRSGQVRQLLLAERLNPLTGAPNGRNPRKRQLLRLRAGAVGAFAAQTIQDPLNNVFGVRLHWDPRDALRHDYSFTSFCGGVPTADISLFHGNLVPVYEGRPLTAVFHEPGTDLPADTAEVKQRHFARLDRSDTGFDWVLAPLPEGPLAYRPTPTGGEVPARSTLFVEVTIPAGGTDAWDEVESLVHSDASAEQGDHFMVETDEHRRSVLRFGNGTNGVLLPRGATVRAAYQIGGGAAGNVGADQLLFARPLTGVLSGAIQRVWNPFDVTDGRDPEPPEKIRRNAPEAYRARQLRAVTLADYVRRAEEVPGVARAVARYAWTGSWRTVRVTVDPEGTTVLEEPLRAALAAHLESVRLIGEDLELRPPRFVPLDIQVVVCAQAEVWREDLRFVLEQEFADDWTRDGRRGFFHPDEWTFGQALHRSRIEGRLHQVAGIEHVVSIVMKRFDAPTPGVADAAVLEVGFDEVVLLANDPDHLERGLIRFDIRGGRG